MSILIIVLIGVILLTLSLTLKNNNDVYIERIAVKFFKILDIEISSKTKHIENKKVAPKNHKTKSDSK